MNYYYNYYREPMNSDGCSLTTVIQVVLVILKLVGTIDWPWWAVLLPLEISIGFVLLGLLILALIKCICR